MSTLEIALAAGAGLVVAVLAAGPVAAWRLRRQSTRNLQRRFAAKLRQG